MEEISFNTFLQLFSTLVSSKVYRYLTFSFVFFRYRTNLVAAKENELSKKVLWTNLLWARMDFNKELGWMEGRYSGGLFLRTGGRTKLCWGCYLLICFLVPQEIQQFKFSSQTYQEYNQYITAIVGCLWTSSVFQKDIHPQGLRMDDELLKKMAVQEFKTSFNIVNHPAMIGYAVLFLQQVMM